jgi:hypothetical protein
MSVGKSKSLIARGVVSMRKFFDVRVLEDLSNPSGVSLKLP